MQSNRDYIITLTYLFRIVSCVDNYLNLWPVKVDVKQGRVISRSLGFSPINLRDFTSRRELWNQKDLRMTWQAGNLNINQLPFSGIQLFQIPVRFHDFLPGQRRQIISLESKNWFEIQLTILTEFQKNKNHTNVTWCCMVYPYIWPSGSRYYCLHWRHVTQITQ